MTSPPLPVSPRLLRMALAGLLHLLLLWAALHAPEARRLLPATHFPTALVFLDAPAPARSPSPPATVATPRPVRATSQRTATPPPTPSAPTLSFVPAAPAPDSAAPASSALDLDSLRQSARQFGSDREWAQQDVRTRLRERNHLANAQNDPLADGVRRAQKADCRQAFSGLGLLAVVPLAASTVADVGCKW